MVNFFLTSIIFHKIISNNYFIKKCIINFKKFIKRDSIFSKISYRVIPYLILHTIYLLCNLNEEEAYIFFEKSHKYICMLTPLRRSRVRATRHVAGCVDERQPRRRRRWLLPDVTHQVHVTHAKTPARIVCTRDESYLYPRVHSIYFCAVSPSFHKAKKRRSFAKELAQK